MRNSKYVLGVFVGLTGVSGLARGATIVNYTATAAPSASPDGVDQTGTAVDVWQESVTAGTSGGAGSYINNGWEIYSYPDATGPTIDEAHTFTGGSVGVGQTVSISFANSAVQAGQPVGISLLGGSTPITFSFTGGDTSGHYRYSDAGGTNKDTGLGFEYQTNFPVSFTFTSATTYTATAGTASFSGTYSGAVTSIQVFNNAAGNGSDVAFNALAVSGSTAVPEPVSGTACAGLAAAAGLGRRRRR